CEQDHRSWVVRTFEVDHRTFPSIAADRHQLDQTAGMCNLPTKVCDKATGFAYQARKLGRS
ncbi:hypothetical protein, partial [Ruegeria hyattellae]|uniref:hypothetical protein n=1 Tax=Ruegeria hyattellae TaxID=3233337 RepID=UPI00355BCD5D